MKIVLCICGQQHFGYGSGLGEEINRGKWIEHSLSFPWNGAKRCNLVILRFLGQIQSAEGQSEAPRPKKITWFRPQMAMLWTNGCDLAEGKESILMSKTLDKLLPECRDTVIFFSPSCPSLFFWELQICTADVLKGTTGTKVVGFNGCFMFIHGRHPVLRYAGPIQSSWFSR